MSASLVGSEMCIRDRAGTPQEAPPLRSPRCFVGTIRSSQNGAEPFGPVSYTHLTLPTICSV
eukprot:13844886-Alexandrium_andersonii.AAC.1